MSRHVNVDFTAFRAMFPGAQENVYVDVSARGVISTRVRAALDEYLDARMHVGGDKAEMFQTVERCRAAFARLINAEPDEVALVKNISDGINAFATALDWRPGDNVVLCSNLEHPANLLPWLNLVKTRGIAIKGVTAGPDGRMPIAAMIDAMDNRTRVLAVSTVTFAPGFRTPMAALAQACQARGVQIMADSAQSLGVLATDVKRDGIDVLAASTQKGLLGLYGMGFLYVRRQLAEAMTPTYLSRLGVVLDSEHEAASSGIEDYRLAPGARRFDLGNFNYLGAAAAAQGLADLAMLEPSAIEAHACGLAADLRDGLADLGIAVFRSDDPRDNVHIVAIGAGLADQHDATDDADLVSLHEAFIAAGVKHTIRRGLLRLSLHAYNDASDVAAILAVAKAWQAGR